MNSNKWSIALSESVNIRLFGELLATRDWRSHGGWHIKLMLYRTATHYVCRRISYRDGNLERRREQVYISPDEAGVRRFFGNTKIGDEMCQAAGIVDV